MPTDTALDREKLEVRMLLASGIFNRAPNLAHLLNYVCDKYFNGAAEEIKEYNIAVEALGRPPEFDQKRDSIVRVEAHRLRKRLREYYQSEGASHEVHIEIPSGQYTPKFIVIEPSRVEPEATDAVAITRHQDVCAVELPEPEIIPGLSVPAAWLPPDRRVRSWWISALVLALCLVTAYLTVRKLRPAHVVSEGVQVPLQGEEVRILCGVENGSYIDAFERTWQSDRYFRDGFAVQSPRNQIVLGTRDQQLYRNRREGQFRYDIPLKPGVYELRLYFAETMFGDNNVAGGGETTRLFEVRINGRGVLSFFDVVADAGPSTADIKVFKNVSPGPDGKLRLEFFTNTNLPFINAIEILPGIPGKTRPLRIVARDRGLKDNEGRSWDPDRYARGGQLIPRPESNVQSADPELFRSERFGNLTYTIPVDQTATYGVSLYFAESWFGPGNPGGGGIGSRTFDILINGVMLRKDFDVFKEAGGSNRASIVSEHGIEPNHQGKIVISLVPDRNYASINALEVIDESR